MKKSAPAPHTNITRYRGQAIHRDDATPIDRKGRYIWRGRAFAQLNHAKTAIDKALRDCNAHTARELRCIYPSRR